MEAKNIGIEDNGNLMPSPPAKIKVFGVGGGGCNAVRRMARGGLNNVELYAVNTDAVALAYTTSAHKINKIQIGPKQTKGLGAGGDPSVGSTAAEESREYLRHAVRDADMVFIASGMGGGTGTGAAPVLAEVSKESGALTISIVTKPFGFEGIRRGDVAMEGIARLQPACDTLIIVPNDRLLALCDRSTPADSAFKMADDILFQGVDAISSVITTPGEINLDFADVKAVMKGMGPAWLSIGRASGQKRAVEAARACIASPLLDTSVEGATAILFTFTAATDVTLTEIEEAAGIIRKAADPAANIIFGMKYAHDMSDEVKITLIATGFNYKQGQMSKSALENEIAELHKCLQDEDQLEIPAFLRRPIQTRRREIAVRAQQSSEPRNNSETTFHQPELTLDISKLKVGSNTTR
ncbi:cell division protein FtsZ [Chloroflexota bacterium]